MPDPDDPDDQPSGPPLLPVGFRVGTAGTAYQVEGSASADGKGPSIWDSFTARPGAILDASTGERACDSYRRVAEDAALMAGLGTGGHRFSIAWSRVQPAGYGPVNHRGLDHYDRLVDTLLAHGQQPMATLYGWDLPQALEDDGGWLNRRTIDCFAEYAAVVGERLGDRVQHWVPVDQPNVASFLGYAIGEHAPGRALTYDALQVSHHLLLAHGRAAIALRSTSTQGSPVSVGCANNHAPMVPASRGAADMGATKLFDALWNGVVLEPMLLGRYPVDLEPLLDGLVGTRDLATIRQPLDFYGVSYEHPIRVAATADEEAELPFELAELDGYATTDVGHPIVPDALRGWLEGMHRRFGAALPPVVVTASGGAFSVVPGADGLVDDQARIAYLDGHLRAVAHAIDRGADVRGFYVRSLLDGFEWADGYTQRYGLVHVDHATGARTPKASYHWLAATMAAQPAG